MMSVNERRNEMSTWNAADLREWARGCRRTCAVAAMAMTLACGCGKKEEAPPVAVNVEAATVTRQDMAAQFACDATLSPVAQAAIVPKISAPVKKFYVKRGSKVKEGELLAVLENRDLEAAAMDNQGGYTQAEAAYATATKAQVPEDFQKAQLDLEQAKANLDVTQQIFNSRKDLFAQGAIPGRDLDTARVNLVQAQAQYDTANKHFASMQAVSRDAALKGAEGQLHSAKGKYLGAEAQLGYSEIRSPISGVVTDRPLFAGEMPAQGAALVTVMDTSSLIAKAHLPQAQAQQLKMGAPAEVHVPGMKDAVTGKVSLISPALDTGSTTVEVWVRIENRKGELKAGTPVHIVLTGESIPSAMVVPAAAIVSDAAGKKQVMVIGADGKAHATPVETGVTEGEFTEIRKGLSGGERVVSEGAYGLDDGTTVHVLSAAEMEKQEQDKGAEKSGSAGPD
jgi:HlyD family secretion protein